MREMKKQMYLRWDELLAMLAIVGGGFLFGEIMLLVVVSVGNEKEIFEIGTLMAVVAVLFLTMFTGVSAMALCFNMGIGMSDTRRRLVPATFIWTYLECLIVVGVIWLLHCLEVWIFQKFYAELKNEMDLGFLFQWKYILVVCVVMVAIQALFGMLFLRYGKVTYWLIWALWMLLCLGVPRIVESLLVEKNMLIQPIREFFRLFMEMGENAVLAGVAGLAVILILISYRKLCKQQVTL